jgi:hypothetical protein
MQTFIPYQDFMKSFKVLDYKRLGKQRVEAMQILNVLTGVQTTKGWVNHPAVRMWESYEDSLMVYHDLCILEWCSRGYQNNMKFKISNNVYELLNLKIELPWWMGIEEIHRSHRSRLIEKDKGFYLPKFPDDEGYNNGKYWWPDCKTKKK